MHRKKCRFKSSNNVLREIIVNFLGLIFPIFLPPGTLLRDGLFSPYGVSCFDEFFPVNYLSHNIIGTNFTVRNAIWRQIECQIHFTVFSVYNYCCESKITRKGFSLRGSRRQGQMKIQLYEEIFSYLEKTAG